jgi:hypothetical protein
MVRSQEFGGCDHNVHPKPLMAYFWDEQSVTVVKLLPRGTRVNSNAILKHYEVCMLAVVEFVPEETCLKRN